MRKRVKIFDNEDDMYSSTAQPKDQYRDESKRVHFKKSLSAVAQTLNLGSQSEVASETESESSSESESHGRSVLIFK